MKKIWVLVFSVLIGGCATRGPLNIECPQFQEALRQQLPPSQLEREITGQGASRPLLTDVEQVAGLLQEQKMLSEPAGQGALAARALAAEQVTRLNRMLDLVLRQPRTGPPSVLLLSGGGQWGAFGAGFLDRLHQQRQLPEFSVITGVSTGGLQSMFVAVGDDEAFRGLVAAYSPASEGEIVDRNDRWKTVYKGSMAGLLPLKKRIEDGICRDLQPGCLMDRLKQQAGKKAVFIGFVEAETGTFYFADAVQLANLPDRAAARQCLTGVALASSAMPVFFQPVSINGKTYYDGGVRQSIFTARILNQLNQRMLRGTGPKAAPIYVIRNGPTDLQKDENVDGSGKALTAALRAYSIIVNQVEVGSIAALRTENSKGHISLVTADGYGDDGGCRKEHKEAMFEPEFMACLRAFGKAKAEVPAEGRWISLSAVPLPGDPSAEQALRP